ncbi:MAG: hypothetical protein R3E96_05985 [Planctomycetota bacterium]
MFARLVLLLACAGSVPAQQVEVPADLAAEWRVRTWAREPALHRGEWFPLLAGPEGTERFDAWDAISRCPEAAFEAWLAFGERVPAMPGDADEIGRYLRWLRWIQARGIELEIPELPRLAVLTREAQEQAWQLQCEGLFAGGAAPDEARWRALVQYSFDGAGRLPQERWHELAPGALLLSQDWTSPCAEWFRSRDGQWEVSRLSGDGASLLRAPLGAGFLDALKAGGDGAGLWPILASAQQAFGAEVRPVAELAPWLAGWTGEPDSEEVLRKRALLAEWSRLGVPGIGEALWAWADTAQASPGGWEAWSGPVYAAEDLRSWAAESLPLATLLQRAAEADDERALLLLDAAVVRLAQAEPAWLAPLLDERRGDEVRLAAFTALEAGAPSPERRAMLLGFLADGQDEISRRAFRNARTLQWQADEWQRALELWKAALPEQRCEWLRELPAAQLPEAFRAICREQLRRSGRSLGARGRVGGGRGSRRARPTGGTRSARWAELAQGEGPGAEETRHLAGIVAALTRLQSSAAGVWLARILPEHLQSIGASEPAGAGLNFEQALALLGRSPEGRRFLPVRWKLRGVAAASAHRARPAARRVCGGGNRRFARAWLLGPWAEDLDRAGVVLRERAMTALAQRTGPPLAPLLEGARNLRLPATVRGAAMRGLVGRDAWPIVVECLRDERTGEGVRLAAEALIPVPQPGIAEVLRDRMALAAAQVRAGGVQGELGEELLVTLQQALVKRGDWGPQDAPWALLGPLHHAVEEARHNLSGTEGGQRWPMEIELIAALAQRRRVAEFLQQLPSSPATLGGGMLMEMAQRAWAEGDGAGALELVRWAEVALAGEAWDPRTERMEVGAQVLRLMIAYDQEQWPLVRTYCLALLERYRQGGAVLRQLQGVFGTQDLRVGVQPEAWLKALWWQAGAREWAGVDETRAQACAEQARRHLGRSQRARREQARLGR